MAKRSIADCRRVGPLISKRARYAWSSWTGIATCRLILKGRSPLASHPGLAQQCRVRSSRLPAGPSSSQCIAHPSGVYTSPGRRTQNGVSASPVELSPVSQAQHDHGRVLVASTWDPRPAPRHTTMPVHCGPRRAAASRMPLSQPWRYDGIPRRCFTWTANTSTPAGPTSTSAPARSPVTGTRRPPGEAPTICHDFAALPSLTHSIRRSIADMIPVTPSAARAYVCRPIPGRVQTSNPSASRTSSVTHPREAPASLEGSERPSVRMRPRLHAFSYWDPLPARAIVTDDPVHVRTHGRDRRPRALPAYRRRCEPARRPAWSFRSSGACPTPLHAGSPQSSMQLSCPSLSTRYHPASPMNPRPSCFHTTSPGALRLLTLPPSAASRPAPSPCPSARVAELGRLVPDRARPACPRPPGRSASQRCRS